MQKKPLSLIGSSFSIFLNYYQLAPFAGLILYTWNPPTIYHSHVGSIEIHHPLALTRPNPGVP
jgi:hypothetical protein